MASPKRVLGEAAAARQRPIFTQAACAATRFFTMIT